MLTLSIISIASIQSQGVKHDHALLNGVDDPPVLI